jgi:hypothetical protein
VTPVLGPGLASHRSNSPFVQLETDGQSVADRRPELQDTRRLNEAHQQAEQLAHLAPHGQLDVGTSFVPLPQNGWCDGSTGIIARVASRATGYDGY